MSQRLTALTAAICVAIVVALGTGCVDLCPGAKQIGGENQRFTVTIADPYVEGGAYPYNAAYLRQKHFAWPSCAAFDGIRTGTVLRMRTVDIISNGPTCNGLLVRIESGPPELTLNRIKYGIETFLGTAYTASIGGCEGVWMFWFEGTVEGSVFSPPVSGELPVVLAIREFEPLSTDAGENDCRPCSDAFVVHLEKKR